MDTDTDLEPAAMSPHELRLMKEDADTWRRLLRKNPAISTTRIKLVAHILYLEDELERISEERDSVRDRHANEIMAGRVVTKSLRDQITSLRNELQSVQEDGNRLLIAVEQIRKLISEPGWAAKDLSEILRTNGLWR